MAYRLKSGDKNLTKTLRRVARDQLDKAIAAVGDETGATLPATIHDVRKHTKKTRGLLRLVRPALPAYSAENAALRDAAMRLSPLRDRGTLIEAYDALFDRFPAEPRQPYAPLRAALTLEHKAVVADPDTFEQLYAFRDDLANVRERTDKWKLTEADGEAVALGLIKTYERAQKAMAKARKKLTAERLHEWRERPAVILGIPVGFIGAAEAKAALADNDLGVASIVVHGRRGGSAGRGRRRRQGLVRGLSASASALWRWARRLEVGRFRFGVCQSGRLAPSYRCSGAVESASSNGS